MKKWIKNNYIYFITFFGTMIFLMVLLFYGLKIHSTGNNVLLTSDLYDQYINFFNYCRDSILNGEFLFHSFDFSIGNNFYGILTYFCLSPLNIIILFSNTQNIVYFIELLIVLKICLCSLTMSIYLKNKFNCKNAIIILLSIAYALSSYNLAYMINLMWLDVVILLPLILLGLEKLIDKGSKKLYILCLSLAIFANYYIAFPVCLFLIMYFFYYCLSKKLPKKEIVKKGKSFAFSSFLCGLLNAAILLPTISNMLNGKFVNAVGGIDKFLNFNPFNIFSQFMIKNTTMPFYNDLPHFYATILVFVLVILSFFNSKFTKREKTLNFFAISFMTLIPIIGFLDKAFHCFRLPNQFPYRYAFILPCLLIPIACKSFINIKEIDLRNYKIYLTFLIFIIILLLTNNIEFALLSSITIIIIYLLSLLFFKNKAFIILTIFVIFEIYLNFLMLYQSYGFATENDYQKLYKYADTLDLYKPSNNEFYRIEGIKTVTNNDNFTLGLYGINTFSPTLTNDVNYFMKDVLGFIKQSKYVIKNIGGTTFSKSLLGLKYEYEVKDTINVQENLYAFPILFRTKYFDKLNLGDLIENQNNLYKLLSESEDELYEEYDSYWVNDCLIKNGKIISEEKLCTFVNTDVSDNYEHYILVKPTDKMRFKVLKDDFHNYEYSDELILKIDDELSMFFTENIEHIKFYQVKKSLLASLKIKLNNTVEINYRDQNNITLTVENASDDEMIFTSIPYDEGWHAVINGNEVKPIKVLNSLIGIKIPEGNATIELYFIPKYYISGTIISSLTFALLFAIYYRKRHFN